ncbi:MAG: hypothetical protein KAV87_66135, partial [Desulfobacteraceae bacterium]|nr:hypothetical protein [Desulfobacteraceae bacterium]
MKSSTMAQGRSGRIKRWQKAGVLLLCIPPTLIALMLLAGKLLAESSTKAAGNSPVGPYTEIQLPLEDLPALNDNLVYNPVLDQYPSGASLQIMYVLDDPRNVPLARYAYNKSGYGIISPVNMPSSWSGTTEYDVKLEELK